MPPKVGPMLGVFSFGRRGLTSMHALTSASATSGCETVIRKSSTSDNWVYVPQKEISKELRNQIASKIECTASRSTKKHARQKTAPKSRSATPRNAKKAKTEEKRRETKATTRQTGPKKTKETEKKPRHRIDEKHRGSGSTTMQKTPAAEIEKRMRLVSGIYNSGYAFPEWSIDLLMKNYKNIMKKVRVFYDQGDALKIVKTLAKEREPVNIAMTRLYDEKQMKAAFGWDTGAYGRIKDPKPNIAIYTPSFLNGDPSKIIHIYNAVGLAFDSQHQPDYRYYVQENKQHTKKLVLDTYSRIFEKIFKATEHLKMKEVVMSLVGGNNFAEKYRDNDGSGIMHFQRNIWLPAFLSIRSKHPRVKVHFMGTSGSFISSELKKIGQDIGFFPANVDRVDTSRTLFINAWDPWSFAGNGNKGDNSLDGYIGRVTNIALSSWPCTNTYLQNDNSYVVVK